MSKMSEISTAIEELRNAAIVISRSADWLSEHFCMCDSAPPTVTKPANEPELKLEDVRAVLADMSRKGYTANIRDLLLKYGASKLSLIDPANYKALLKDVEELNHA